MKIATDALRSRMEFVPDRQWWLSPVATEESLRRVKAPASRELSATFAPEEAFRAAAEFIVRRCADIVVAIRCIANGRWNLLVLQRTDEWISTDGRSVAPIPGHLWNPGGKVPTGPEFFMPEWQAALMHLSRDLNLRADAVERVFKLGEGRTWLPQHDRFVYLDTETGRTWQADVENVSAMDTSNGTFLALLKAASALPEVACGKGASAAFWMEEGWFIQHNYWFNPYVRALFAAAFEGLKHLA